MNPRLTAATLAALLIACSTPPAADDTPDHLVEATVIDRDVLTDCTVEPHDDVITEVVCDDFVVSVHTGDAHGMTETRWWEAISGQLRQRYPGRFTARSGTTDIDGQSHRVRRFEFDEDGQTTRNGIFTTVDDARGLTSYVCFHPHHPVDLPMCRRALEQVIVDGIPAADASAHAAESTPAVGQDPTLAGIPIEAAPTCHVDDDVVQCPTHVMNWHQGTGPRARQQFERSVEGFTAMQRQMADADVDIADVDCSIADHPAHECRRIILSQTGLTVIGYAALARADDEELMVMCTFQNATPDDIPELCRQVLSVDTDTAPEPGVATNDGPPDSELPDPDEEPELQTSCDDGDINACRRLGTLLQHKPTDPITDPDGPVGPSQDTFDDPQQMLEAMCDDDIDTACTTLAVRLLQAPDREQHIDRARALLQKTCDGGERSGCTNLARTYQFGDGTDRDAERAHELYLKACELGDGDGCEKAAIAPYNGVHSVEQDYLLAARLYAMGCGAGNAASCTFLGTMYFQGLGVDLDHDRAEHFLEEGCRRGDENGCFNLQVLDHH